MLRRRYRNRIFFIFITCLLFLLYVSGIWEYLFTLSYDTYYIHNGPSESLSLLISKLERNSTEAIKPINKFSYAYSFNPKEKCKLEESVRILFVIASMANHFEQRKTIRKTWGDENRFSDVIIRRVFLLAKRASDETLQALIEREANIYRDVIQGNFEESYDNLTLKTVMGLDWTFHNCKNANYYFFVDDNIYVSTRNVLRFIKSPLHYPSYLQTYAATSVNEVKSLYAGKLYKEVTPIRFYFSKYYVSLKDYPYSYWPPYLWGAFYALSRDALEKLYYGIIYTENFRLEDVFLGMAAKKAGLKLVNQDEIYLLSKLYSPDRYQWVLAIDGFEDPNKLLEVWNEQRAAGNA